VAKQCLYCKFSRILKENTVFALKNTHDARKPLIAMLMSAAIPLLLAACSKPAEKSEDIRPVRTIVLRSSSADVNAEFSGEVRPRIESRLGFRVGGKITARKVDVGAPVKRGQVLMQLDPQDLKLSQAQALANLRAAETTRDLARSELKRYQELRVKNFVSRAIIDAKVSAFDSSLAAVDAAQAGYRGQSNQAGYATLVSDTEGVVTAVDAEVGQVVAAGTPVVRVARLDQKEIVIGLPEDKVDSLRQVADVTVRLWADPGTVIPGKIREVSPVADPSTRTFPVRVSIPAQQPNVKLGMTALVQFSSTTDTPRIRVPLTALHQEKGITSVWLVEKGVVRMVPVQLGGVAGNDILLLSGVQAGQTVVTAGANLLKNGQKVKLLGGGQAVRAEAAASGAAQ
jgi:multidrug efflux system membrane fusion protein